MNTDLLIKIVETQLQETTNMREKTPDFIRKVVHIYTLQLMKSGNIPVDFMEDVLSDIEAETIEIYRKKTYGFLTLEEYRRHKFRQPNDN
ncbi:DNA-dependent DNA polymerase [Bdellovibrio sp. 22V]|uniref:DNA-dependent DNA polymerase n=1 Tax=Bdellovibrio TaxID=958 RepID=UPI0025434548|nr:DNA-dependent DNA polymerase [Bdellovibrio sp. 22V]WII71279.1 DNA-dependent DNA polymerase [Bdellovibrio sp. 22V]